MPDYLLPDVGEGLTEADIVSWKVAVGDVVAVNDVVVEIETAKSLVELPSPYAGEVAALLVAEGETVAVGTPIITVAEVGAPARTQVEVRGAPAPSLETTPGDHPEIDPSNPAATGGGEGESLVGRMKADRGPVRRARRGPVSPTSEAGASTQMQVQGAFAPGGAQSDEVMPADETPVPDHDVRVDAPGRPDALVPERVTDPAALRALAKPPVRKLARALGVDLGSVRATGPGGTVTREDVEGASGLRAAAAEPGGAARTGAAGGRETRQPVKGVRRAMATAMRESAFTAPHVTEWVTIDATATVELVERLRTHREFRDVKVSPLLVLARAVTLAVRRTPEINSWWDDAAQEVVLKHDVHLGIAAATPRGLVVPNVKGAQDLSLRDLATALTDLTTTAREGRTQPADMAGGTFTITNVGVFGVDAGTPIINPGESAILCLGAIRKQPWVVTRDGVDEVVPRHVTTLALSFDHRHIDGQMGSAFLADVAGILADPATALLF